MTEFRGNPYSKMPFWVQKQRYEQAISARSGMMSTQTRSISMATAPKEPRPQITLLEAMQALTEKHGSQAEAARQCEINKTYWSRLMSGIKEWPSDETLGRLGLRRNVSYEWIKQPRAKKVA